MMDDEISSLIASIYSAFFMPDETVPMLTSVMNFVGAEMGFLAHADGPTNITAFHLINHNPETQKLYNERFASLDPRADIALISPVGSATHAQTILKNEAIEKTEYFDEFLRKSQAKDTLYGIIGSSEKTGHVGISINRRFCEDFFDKRHTEKLSFLMPHFVNALNLSTDLRGAVLARALLQRTTDAFFLLASAEGHVAPLDDYHQEALNGGLGLTTEGGKLKTVLPRFQDRLEKAIASALEEGRGDSFLMPVSIGQSCTVRVGPVPEEIRPMILDFNQPYALVQIQPPVTQSKNSLSLFASSFGLTPREAALLKNLSETFNLRHAANLNEISYETARSYLKSILAKTHSEGQAELLVKLERANRS